MGAMIIAAEQAGWQLSRWESAGFTTFQFHRDAELGGTLRPGDRASGMMESMVLGRAIQ